MVYTIRLFKTLFFSVTVLFCAGWFNQRPVNLSTCKEDVERYYEDGWFQDDISRAVRHAIKHFKRICPTDKSVVIFDIDDTIFSTYCREKTVSFGWSPEMSHEWVMKGNLRAIPETKKLYDYLVGRGFHIIFLTGRKAGEYHVTIKNLKDQGFTTFDTLIVRSDKEQGLTASEYKAARRKELLQEGYCIVGNVGDQWSDHEGGNDGYFVKIPNPLYLIP